MKTKNELLTICTEKNYMVHDNGGNIAVSYRKNMVAWFKVIVDFSTDSSFVILNKISSELTGLDVHDFNRINKVQDLYF